VTVSTVCDPGTRNDYVRWKVHYTMDDLIQQAEVGVQPAIS